MSGIQALPALVRGVRAGLVANGVTANVVLGWTARSRQNNQGSGGGNRVVFVPGRYDPTSGAPKVLPGGTLDRDAPQMHVTLNPRRRALAWDHGICTVSVWGINPDRPQDEEGQIEATLLLREQTIAAIHNAVDPETGTGLGFANVEAFGDWYWTLPPGENGFGREITFGVTLLGPSFDWPVAIAFPGGTVARDPDE